MTISIWQEYLKSWLLVLDRDTWNHTIVYKSFILSRNIWYIIVCKKSVKKRQEKKVNVQGTQFPNSYA